MALWVRRSILKQGVVAISCGMLACGPMAVAQRPGHNGGVPVHVAAPPIYHAPISSPPIPHMPAYHAPMLSSPSFAQRWPISSSAAALNVTGFRFPRRPIRPFPPVFVVFVSPILFEGPFWGSNWCAFATCDFFWPWTVGYTNVYSPGPVSYLEPTVEAPVYVYGDEGRELPQLFLRDGTVLNVNDYWVVDGELHFTLVEAEGAKPMEHEVPFDSLDLQKTIDVNTRRGFRFMLRNEPVEQYWRDHPEGPPGVMTPPHE